jgi:hypothetical protein
MICNPCITDDGNDCEICCGNGKTLALVNQLIEEQRKTGKPILTSFPKTEIQTIRERILYENKGIRYE